jgi:ABC-type nitrate/sulfonate/bicarbonate transport system substrate-binding protein
MWLSRPFFMKGVARIILTVMLGFGLATLATAHPSLGRVTLQLKWRHQFQFAGYYAAQAKGFYREAGLEVVLKEAQPGLDPTHEVLAGKADYGVGNSDLLLLRHRGEPVVVLAAIFQHSPMVLLVRAASGVTDLQGLHDRELMMLTSESAELFAYFKFEGIDPAKLRVRPHTLNIEDFISGKVDGMSAYGTDEPWNLRQRGVPFLQFTPRAGGIDFYGDNLFTTEHELAEHPERVRAFRAASLRGWEYALNHPEEIIELIRRDYPSRLSREHLQFEAEQTRALMHPGLIEVGHMNPGRWRHMVETYAEFGMLPRDFSLAGFLYDPNPQPDYRWVYWSLGGAAVLLVGALGWVWPLVRLNRRLRAANAAKSHYLAFLTHEIRTPLNGLVGSVDLLKQEPLPPASRDQIRVLEHSAQHLLQLVDNVLDHSRLEAGGMKLELQPLAVVDFAEGISSMYAAGARAKGLELRHEVRPGVPAAIQIDGGRLQQIVGNLLGNAVKFTGKGSVELVVEPGSAPGRVRFHVKDTGPGIPPARHHEIFRPYAQADASIARRFGGSGLGLSIARQLAELMGGSLTVQSAVGVGSTFTVELPASEVRVD